MVSIVFLAVAGVSDPRWWVFASVAVLITTLLAHQLTHRILTEPLDQLHQALSVASRGGAWREPNRPVGDELGRLNQTVGGIVEALERSQEELRQHKSQFEQKVLRRTSELERKVEQAERATAGQRDFLANMAQDLRQPVNGVLGTIDIVLDTRLTPEQREQLETAQRCVYSALAMLKDVLDLSRIESGQMTLEKAPLNLREILEGCLRGLQTRLADKHITATTVVDTSVPRRLEGDASRLRQILWHLLNTSVHLAEGGDFRVQAVAKPAGAGLSEVTLEIRYSGPGFTEEGSSDEAPRNAAGLGLSISRKLALLHGGEVLCTQDDKLTVISARLVLGVLKNPVAEPAPSQPTGSAVLDPARPGAKILVAEDSLVNQKVIAAVLKKRGYRVLVAADGREALKIVEESLFEDPVKLILMDVQMPLMDGLEATRALRQTEEWRTLPIVAMTAHSMSGDRERCLEAGMTGYIPKPVNAAHLIQTIEDQLNGTVASPSRSDSTRSNLESYPEIAQGLQELFIQIAPDRLRRLASALESGDRSALQTEARKVAAGAERIHAAEVGGIARRIETKAPYLEAPALREELESLGNALRALETCQEPFST